MTIDYKDVAETLGEVPYPGPHIQAAITLCLLAAKLPVGEAERVLEAARCQHEYAVPMHAGDSFCIPCNKVVK